MKLLALALSVVLLFSAGEALTCHRCTPAAAGEECHITMETCPPGKDACAYAEFLRAPHGRYQKCMSKIDCEMLKLNAFINMKCCDTDMCNTA
ncbi:uncharacterized protein ly97.3 [Stigmatopora nigra]